MQGATKRPASTLQKGREQVSVSGRAPHFASGGTSQRKAVVLGSPFLDHAANVSENPNVSFAILLRPVAARKLLRLHDLGCREAAGKPDIHINRRVDLIASKYIAD